MKIITLSITLTILALVNIAEASLFGRVVSISGEPVNGAMIKILPHGEVVWTNKDGYFKFEKARLDVEKINISRLGYATISRELNDTELKNGYALIRLKPLPISMKGVVVTEKRKPGELRKNATPSLREMDGRQILEIPGANQDLLRSLTYLPGI
ncbi:MAG: carboxypeptidase-like regulatory domain-containing protein, partial [candidate division Zixibacteria bacterium]|nr:carboxypeptidase-like regulatory domain-containing protein [candidate division Zixibacteria bacterium]